MQTYFKKWKIKINEEKTKLIIMAAKHRNRNKPARIQIGNTKIEEEKTVKYLGVKIDNKLKMHHQAKEVIKKGYEAMSYIYPYINHQSPLSTKMKKQLYI